MDKLSDDDFEDVLSSSRLDKESDSSSFSSSEIASFYLASVILASSSILSCTSSRETSKASLRAPDFASTYFFMSPVLPLYKSLRSS